MGKKLTKEEFIDRAREIHGERYDYSKVEYINGQTKVCIICPIHGEFWQVPNSHLNGIGCPKCGIESRREKRSKTKDQFIQEAREVHGDKYDYSKVEYIGNKIKVCIICPEHGEFWQTPDNHLQGSACPKCRNEYVSKLYKDTTETFIEKARKVHGNKYDYSKVQYVDSHTKVCIICPKHGEFWQRPNNHLYGWGCIKCSGGEKKTNDMYIEAASKIYGDKYDYSKMNYVNSKTKITIICPEHGEFSTYPNSHLYRGVGCPQCSIFKLEKQIMDMLDKNGIKYFWNYKPEWLKPKSLDFYLPEHHLAIECQGEQHYRPIKFYGGLIKYNRQVKNDTFKKEKCNEKNIKLVYFTDVKNIQKTEDTFTDILDIEKYILNSRKSKV